MILLDTNIVIDMLNNRENSNWKIFSEDKVVLCGVVIAELLIGVRSKKEEEAVKLFINSLDSLQFLEDDWQNLGMFLANLRKSGISVPFQYAYIAFLAIKYEAKLLTQDKHFKMIKQKYENLRLF